jgi:hypothetical protein
MQQNANRSQTQSPETLFLIRQNAAGLAGIAEDWHGQPGLSICLAARTPSGEVVVTSRRVWASINVLRELAGCLLEAADTLEGAEVQS